MASFSQTEESSTIAEITLSCIFFSNMIRCTQGAAAGMLTELSVEISIFLEIDAILGENLRAAWCSYCCSGVRYEIRPNIVRKNSEIYSFFLFVL